MSRQSTYGDEQFKSLVDEDSTFIEGKVFVIMPFSQEEGFDDVYSAIEDECNKLGLTSERVDRTFGSGLILKKILNGIENAEFLVVDLSLEKPNVYYELGYAHGVGNTESDILMIARDGTKLHFDVSPISVNFYKSTEDLRRILSRNLKYMIEITR